MFAMIELNDGHRIPQIGFGTWRLSGEETRAGVRDALEVGYRHIDTATLYNNEREVGQALADVGLPRDEVFVTSKVWNDQHRAADARRAIETSLEKLGLDHLDLYLIHWPATVQFGDSYIECWNALQDFQREGLTRSIGVSNFNDHHVAALEGATPAMNQVELHPQFTQAGLRKQMAARGIQVTSWSPLGRAGTFTDPLMQQICEETGKTPPQVIIRWHLQHGLVVIPRSSSRTHIAANFDVATFELNDEQMAMIDSLDSPEGRRGLDPDTAVFSV